MESARQVLDKLNLTFAEQESYFITDILRTRRSIFSTTATLITAPAPLVSFCPSVLHTAMLICSLSFGSGVEAGVCPGWVRRLPRRMKNWAVCACSVAAFSVWWFSLLHMAEHPPSMKADVL